MKKIVLIWLCLVLGGCSMMRAPSQPMLDIRADYDYKRAEKLHFSGGIPKRSETVMTDIWIHPHETANRDYFLGGGIRTIVRESQWTVDKKEK